MTRPFPTESADDFVRVYSASYGPFLLLHETDEGLEVTADIGDQEATVVLDLDGIRKLRLELQRRERNVMARGVR